MNDDFGLSRAKQIGDCSGVSEIGAVQRDFIRDPAEPGSLFPNERDDLKSSVKRSLDDRRADEAAGAGDEDALVHQAAARMGSAAT